MAGDFLQSIFTGVTVFIFIHFYFDLDKKMECEMSLPRNVECTWQAPKEIE